MTKDVEQSASDSETAGQGSDYLLVVVGFDGSEPAERALQSARRLVAGRLGSLVVVFVARVPGTAAMSPAALGEIRYSLDAEGDQIASALPTLLGKEQRWRFVRRDGDVAEQLMKVAREEASSFGPDAAVIVVVGKASSRLHHYLGSVPVGLVRHESFPVVVVP
jgi:nucleotide-binding universal stress UspA family protein